MTLHTQKQTKNWKKWKSGCLPSIPEQERPCKKMADYAKSIDEKSAELLQAYNDADIVLTVGSISTTKQTSIIYNSSDGKYYLWRYDNGR